MAVITPWAHNASVNHLANASSPYLRQHKDNPVDWYQWGEDAFAAARDTGKPILLSVGYSACHWCHVMAHESFEDADTAAVMNRLFINVKVDREERPDVDAVYMDAVQALTGRGGWPMTVFCTPDGEPFYGGTYYPRDTFVKLMEAVDDAWKNRRDDLQQNVEALLEAIGRTAHVAPAEQIDARQLVSTTIGALQSSFDATWGGFGGAPKFPSTFALDLLLRVFLLNGDNSLVEKVRTSLDAMAAGGMYDHLGGGFSRYSVDEKWLVPHFEKMLYDQALLTRVYLHMWLLSHESRDEQIVRETVNYVLTDLTHPLGGFFSAEDADSLDEHGHSEEGAFYTWTPQELTAALGSDATKACAYWDITDGGNFEGRSIPNRIAQRGDLHRDSATESWRRVLHGVRAQRSRPGLDDKVLLEWNAMMLSSLCEVASAFNDDELMAAATKNARFLVENLRDADGRWRRSWQADAVPQARHAALAHDLAHVVDAMVRMYELTATHEWLQVAKDTAHQLVNSYWDNTNGGFFTVAADGEQLIVRQKDLMDNATPSANSVAAMAFLRLTAVTGDSTWQDIAIHTLRLLARVAPSAPSAFCHAVSASLLLADGATEVVLPGASSEFLLEYRRAWRPHSVVLWGEPTSSSLWTDRQVGHAYVCRNHECLLPATTREEFKERLATNARGE
jgi:uncharacterized protein YyaL (SSP411 family)